MNSTTRHHARAGALASAGIALALTLSACASGGGSTTTADPANSAASDEGLQHAQEQVETYTQVTEGFVPSEPIPGVDSLAGGKVIYIPAAGQIPFFTTSFTALQNAFDVVGVDVELCDAQANPSLAASCLTQAITGNAIGVVFDALPSQIAQEAFTEVAAAGIPIVMGNVPTPEGSPATVRTVGPDTVAVTALAADTIIAASDGTAQALGVQVIDSDTTKSWMQDGAAAEFATYCPDCEFTVIDTKTADLQNAPSKVSAALLADPGIDYLLPQLSPEITPTVQGATDAGRADLPASSTATTLGDLQQIESGSNLKYSVGWDVVRTGWLEADMLMRLKLGVDVDASQYVVPSRIFSADNIGDLELTQEGWDSSDWFGGSDYQDALTALWTGK
jgi:ribose transport system substrate-binding protein